MLLQRLVAMHPERDSDGPAHYRDRPMRWQLALRRDGTPASGALTDLADPTDSTRRFGTSFPVPYTTRTSGVAACLGADDIQYVLGWCDPDSKPNRVAACHTAFIDLVQAWAKHAPEDPAATALVTFYDADHAAGLTRPEEWTSKQSVLITIDGVPVTQSPSLERFWAAEVERRKAGGGPGNGARRAVAWSAALGTRCCWTRCPSSCRAGWCRWRPRTSRWSRPTSASTPTTSATA